MLKRQSRVLSIALVFVFCMSFMVTGFAAPDAAQASSTYDVIKTQSVSNVGEYLTTVKIQIDVPNVAALTSGDLVTIHLPADVIMENSAADNHKQTNSATPDVIFSSATAAGKLVVNLIAGTPGPAGGAADVSVEAPANIGTGTNALNYVAGAPSFVAYPVGNSAIEIKITNTAAFVAGEAGRLYVNLEKCKVAATFDGNITATIAAPEGSGFSSGSAVIAKYVGTGGGTATMAKSVVTMGTAAKALDTIMIQETAKNTLKPGDAITLKLPKGFKWKSADAISAAWGFTGLGMGITIADCVPQTDERKMKITLPAANATWTGASATTEGRLYFNGTIEVDDETEAKLGDVTVHVSGDNVTDQDIVVATYAEYGVTVTEKATKTVAAGRLDTELGSFVITEGMKDSIVPGRTVTFELPSGVEWDGKVTPASVIGTYAPAGCISTKVVKGANWVTAATASLNKNRNVLKLSLAAGAMAKSEIEIKDLKVAISPDFTGDIVVKVGGTAGVEGEVLVAEVVAPLTFAELDAAAANIIIGKQGQVLPDVVLVEGKKEAVKATAGFNNIAIELPFGATFDKLPTATVEEGDITIDRVSYMAGRTGINIAIKGTSDKASKIKLSNLVATLDRTVPEGEFKLSINAPASTALTNTAALFNVTYMGEQAIATCVTPAPGEGTEGSIAGQFKVASNIYSANGMTKVMDAAPYIKNDRTYVPMRYLGETIGAEVLWDATARTVTLVQDGDEVVFTIGSTTYTINGEANVADVAPEITNDRTMLPARFVAEAFGYVVGWDPGTQTVLISL